MERELVKLPKAYYQYANVNLDEKDKEIKDKVVITLSLFVACKLEKACYPNKWTNQRILKQMLLNSKILDEEDLDIKDTERNKYEFENKEPEEFKHIKANKQINIYLSKYAKNKMYKNLVAKGHELTFTIKKELVKAGIITIEDLSY